MREAMLNAGITNAIPAAGLYRIERARSRIRPARLCDRGPANPAAVLVHFDVPGPAQPAAGGCVGKPSLRMELMKADPNWAGMNMVQPRTPPTRLRITTSHADGQEVPEVGLSG